jgi:hypothetical protein
MIAIDRRELLVAAGIAGAAVAGRASARAAAPPRLDGRASAYRALVRSLREAPDGRFRAADPGAAHARFARWYRAQPAVLRRHAAAVLDELRAGGAPSRGELAGRPRSPRRGAVVASAIGLACIGCDPPLGEDERP